MLGALYSAITGMDAAATSMDVIGNNIANVNTCAYKSGTAAFASIYSNSVSILGGATGNEEGLGVQTVGLNAVWQQGAMDSTFNPTDVAIQGDGFFRVDEGANTCYTRAGQFRYNSSYFLTDPDGRYVQGWAYDNSVSPATIDRTTVLDIQVDGTTHDEFQIEADGIVTGVLSSSGARQNLFQVALFDFPNIDGLRKMTSNIYEASNDSGAPMDANGGQSGIGGYGVIQNNHLEMSNVDLAREFVDLIVSQKAFQANSRVISSSSDMLSEVINIIR